MVLAARPAHMVNNVGDGCGLNLPASEDSRYMGATMSEKTFIHICDPPPPGCVGMVAGIRKDVKILRPNYGFLTSYNKEAI